jgi:hypothetical protein
MLPLIVGQMAKPEKDLMSLSPDDDLKIKSNTDTKLGSIKP